MNKEDRKQLERFEKKLDYLNESGGDHVKIAFMGIALAYFAILVSTATLPGTWIMQWLRISALVAGLIFFFSALFIKNIYKKKYEDFVKNIEKAKKWVLKID